MPRFSVRSVKNLAGVHPDLVAVMNAAIKDSSLDFAVTEGLRTLEKQQRLAAVGATTTLNSRHLTGHAVDVAVFVDGQVRWDWPLYETLAVHVKKCALELKIPIEWGGDWKRFRDGPHYQLPWERYPK